MRQYSRRDFLTVATGATGALAVGCSLETSAPNPFTQEMATIRARPGTPTLTPTVGYSALGLTAPRDGMLYVPTTYNASTPAPLLVLLHDSLGNSKFWQDTGVGELLDDLGVVLLAPDSRFANWDLYYYLHQRGEGGFREDPSFVNAALTWLFQRCNINASRIAFAGLGEGAVEATGLGLANGDLFTHVISMSPGVLYAPYLVGKPKIGVTHGTLDEINVFEYTKLTIVPKLQEAGYSVTFMEYDGSHIPPNSVIRQAVEWFLA